MPNSDSAQLNFFTISSSGWLMHSDPLFAAHDSSVYQISLVIVERTKVIM